MAALGTAGCSAPPSAFSSSGGAASAVHASAVRWQLGDSTAYFAYLFAIPLITYVAGQLVALSLFVLVYARRWGRFGWPASLAYAAATCGVVWLVYVKIMHLALYPSLLFG